MSAAGSSLGCLILAVSRQVSSTAQMTAIAANQSYSTIGSSSLNGDQARRTALIAYTIGGDSLAYFMPMITQAEIVELGLINQSPYPVFDVQSRLIDLDEPTFVNPSFSESPSTDLAKLLTELFGL
jgi:hypothetical protein